GRAHGSDRPYAMSLRLIDHAGDCCGRSLERGVDDHTFLVESFSEAGQLRAVDDRLPAPSWVTLGDVELDRVGTGVDDRIAFRFIVDQGRQAARIAGVRTGAE